MINCLLADTANAANRAMIGVVAITVTTIGMFAVAGPAQAQDARSVTVKVVPAEVATLHGRAAVEARIARAARSVCYDGRRDLNARASELACIGRAVAGAGLALAERAALPQFANVPAAVQSQPSS